MHEYTTYGDLTKTRICTSIGFIKQEITAPTWPKYAHQSVPVKVLLSLSDANILQTLCNLLQHSQLQLFLPLIVARCSALRTLVFTNSLTPCFFSRNSRMWSTFTARSCSAIFTETVILVTFLGLSFVLASYALSLQVGELSPGPLHPSLTHFHQQAADY